MQLKSRLIAASLLLVFISAVPAVMAQTTVEADSLFGQHLWTEAESPYIIQDNLVIAENAELTIEPGVEVRFDGPYNLTVIGVISAIGSVNTDEEGAATVDDVNWIRFTQVGGDTLPDSVLWKGIRFLTSDPGSVIQYAIIEYSYARGDWPNNSGGGLYIDGSSPRIVNCIIRECRADQFGGGVYMLLSSSIFRNNEIVYNEAGISGGGIYMDLIENVQLRNLTVCYNMAQEYGHGIYFGPDAAAYVRSSIFWDNDNPDVVGGDHDDYFAAGDEGVDIKYSIVSFLDANDVENFLWNSRFYPDSSYYLADTETFRFFTLTDSSIAVDNGDVFDERQQHIDDYEPGYNGSRINMGAYGGTALANQSNPVPRLIHPADQSRASTLFAFPYVREGETTATLLGITNIGHREFRITPDDFHILPQEDGFETRFSIDDTSWSAFDVYPDSFKVVQVTFAPQTGDAVTIIDTTGGDTTWAIRRMDVDVTLETDYGDIPYVLGGTPVNPIISVTPTTIAFGDVHLGNPVERTFVISNEGTTELTITDSNPPSTATSNFSVERPDVRPFRIQAGESRTYTVICDPQAVIDSLADQVRIISLYNDIEYIGLTAYSIGPILEASVEDEDTLDYNFVDINSQDMLVVDLANVGNDVMYVRKPPTLYAPEDTLQQSPLFYPVIVVDSSTTNPFTDDSVGVQADDTLHLGIVFEPFSEREYLPDDFGMEIQTSLENFSVYFYGRGTSGGQYFAGNIPGGKVKDIWGADGDTMYVCAGVAVIPPGERLTILPGVRVEFEDSEDYIRVEGILEVLGKEGNEVIFSTHDTGPDAAKKGGIRFVAADNRSRMEWAIVENMSTYESDPGVTEEQPDYRNHGGGIAVYNCSPSFYQVTVRNCYSYRDGGGMWIYQSAPTIIRSTFENNEAATDGGGLIMWGSAPEFLNNKVINNHAGLTGGGLKVFGFANAEIYNSLFVGNTAGDSDNGLSGGEGGAVFVADHSSPVFQNCVFYQNDAEYAQVLRAQSRSNPILRNSALMGHDNDPISHGTGGSHVMLYCAFEDNPDPENHVIDIDPDAAFVDLTDFVLSDNSSLIDAGNPGSQYEDYSFPPSRGSSTNDIGLYGGTYAGYWDGSAPLKISFFQNITNPRTLKMVVNVFGDSVLTPGLRVVDTFVDTSDVSLDPIGDNANAYTGSYRIEQSAYLVVEAYATSDQGEDYISRRNITLTLFKPAVGGTSSNPDGIRLILPPNAMDREVVISGRPDPGASLPDDVGLSAPAGARWVLECPVNDWAEPGELVLPYYSEMVRAGAESGLSVWKYFAGQWERMESYVDVSERTVHSAANGSGTYVVVYDENGDYSAALPRTSELEANYPNPFNPVTTIPFRLARSGNVDIRIYNILGQEVARLFSGWRTAGNHRITWNATNGFNGSVASGVYICRMEFSAADGSGTIVDSRKLVLMR